MTWAGVGARRVHYQNEYLRYLINQTEPPVVFTWPCTARRLRVFSGHTFVEHEYVCPFVME